MSVGIKNCYISMLTIGELYFGAYHSQNIDKHLKDVSVISSMFSKVNLSDSILDAYGKIKSDLTKSGQRIDDMDLLIGSTALAGNYILVTDNIKHLGRIPDIKVTNWTER